MHDDPRALRLLREAGFAPRRLEYVYHPGGGTKDAAAQLGLHEHAVIKTLLFVGLDLEKEEQPLVALIHGNLQVSARKLARLAGLRRIRPCSPAMAEELTGYIPGGISPFGMRRPLPVYIQESVLRLDEIVFNAGRRGVVAAVGPAVLTLLGGVHGDFAGRAFKR